MEIQNVIDLLLTKQIGTSAPVNHDWVEASEKNETKQLQRQLDQCSSQLKNSIRTVDFVHVSGKFLIKNNKALNSTRLVQEKKLRNLGFQAAAETNDPTKVIFNFS